MTITVKIFASLREQLGITEKLLAYEDNMTPEQIWRSISGEVSLPAHVLVAVNMEYSDRDQQLTDGDEVAFFPPVTGG